MYTYLNQRYFFTLTGTDGRGYRLEFGPGDVALDDETDVVVAMQINMGSGRTQDLILFPANTPQTQAMGYVADLVADIGAQVLQNQIRMGNVLFDSIAEAMISYAKDYGTGIFKRYFSQVNGHYYDARTGLLMATRALTKYDVSFD